jgi:hypothetical protein
MIPITFGRFYSRHTMRWLRQLERLRSFRTGTDQ